MAEKKHKMRVVDDPAVVETYANKVIGISFDGGACTITLGVQRFVPERIDEAPKEDDHPKIHITHRLAIPPSAAVELINQLNRLLTTFSMMEKAQQEASKSTAH